MDPFLGEIRVFGFGYAPSGWALCQGQLLPIMQNSALFSLLGIQFGGNGQTNFALPDLRGSVASGQGQGPGLSLYTVGQQGGAATVTLTATELPPHVHTLPTGTGGNKQNAPSPSNFLGPTGSRGGSEDVYATPAQQSTNAAIMLPPVGVSGGGQPHNNMAPYLVLNFCIALQGVYPARS